MILESTTIVKGRTSHIESCCISIRQSRSRLHLCDPCETATAAQLCRPEILLFLDETYIPLVGDGACSGPS